METPFDDVTITSKTANHICSANNTPRHMIVFLVKLNDFKSSVIRSVKVKSEIDQVNFTNV